MRDTVRPWGTRLPSLDGWRALSILLVLGHHCSFADGFPPRWNPFVWWVFDGNLGVRCFFLISGLLITWLLLREYETTGSVNFRHFYIRRALRILPVYLAFIAVVLILSACTPFRQKILEWVANLTFTTDFYRTQWTTTHLWSLAVEEQFYLLWPVVLVVLLRLKTGWRVYAALLLIVFLTAAVSRTLGYFTYPGTSRNPLLAEFSFFNYWDTIALGCAAAALIHRRPAWLSILATRPLPFAVLGSALFLLPYVGWHSLLFIRFAVPLRTLLEAFGLAILIVRSVAAPRWPVYRLLNLRGVQAFGVLSYSIYIWQQIFCTKPHVFGLADVWWLRFPGWLLPTFAVALLSYYGLELPLMKLRHRFRAVAHADERAVVAPLTAGLARP